MIRVKITKRMTWKDIFISLKSIIENSSVMHIEPG
jgi:hypothetical protein